MEQHILTALNFRLFERPDIDNRQMERCFRDLGLNQWWVQRLNGELWWYYRILYWWEYEEAFRNQRGNSLASFVLSYLDCSSCCFCYLWIAYTMYCFFLRQFSTVICWASISYSMSDALFSCFYRLLCLFIVVKIEDFCRMLLCEYLDRQEITLPFVTDDYDVSLLHALDSTVFGDAMVDCS